MKLKCHRHRGIGRHAAVRNTINERHCTHGKPVKMHNNNAPWADSTLLEILKRPKARTQKTARRHTTRKTPEGTPHRKPPGGTPHRKTPQGHTHRHRTITAPEGTHTETAQKQPRRAPHRQNEKDPGGHAIQPLLSLDTSVRWYS